MGAISCHNYHSQKKRVSFVQAIDSFGQNHIPQNNLDLPYRHYIKKNIYIPSALSHSPINFHGKSNIRISKGIQQSSIMLRRFSEKIQGPSFPQIQIVQIQV